MQKSLQELVKTHGNVPLGTVTVDQAVGGARGVPCILWETSLLNEQTVRVYQRRPPGAALGVAGSPRLSWAGWRVRS